jgi:hypothetical protein
MCLETLSQWMLVAALLGQVPPGQPAIPQPIVTRQAEFAIPFRIDQPNPTRRPVEVQLYVSTDRGRHWQFCAKASPNQQQFVFRAPNDGEYWFAIRTMDPTGQVRPQNITTPGLCVRVDTRSSQMQQGMANRPAGGHPGNPSGPNIDPQGSVAIAINPAIAKKVVIPHAQQAARAPALPAGERPRMIRSKKFELEYDVDSVGPSGIGRVELWGTRDGGKTWASYAIDGDNRSPIIVNVDQEGVFGFCLVVTNGAGVGNKPPASGDLPELWVDVDVTKPTARLISVTPGMDQENGSVIISWQADDRQLSARPVSLYFATSPSGPWTPIASGLENTGRYAWPIERGTPGILFFRLEVRDEAGNVGEAVTTEAVTVDQARPKARMRDVRAVTETGSRPYHPW